MGVDARVLKMGHRDNRPSVNVLATELTSKKMTQIVNVECFTTIKIFLNKL